MDYEEVIHLLEAEIAELKTQRVEHPAMTKKVANHRVIMLLKKKSFVLKWIYWRKYQPTNKLHSDLCNIDN